jgi:hypothetical protein
MKSYQERSAEGCTLYRFPGPQFRHVTDDGSAEASYYTWIDQRNTLGLGANVPIATGNLSDSYFALVDGKFMTALRVRRGGGDGVTAVIFYHRRASRDRGPSTTP